MNNIDYIIFKVLSNEATGEEQKLFDVWLNEDLANYSEFIKLEFYWNSQVESSHSVNANDAYARFKNTKLNPLKKDHKFIRQIIWGVVSTVAAVALLLLTVKQPVNNDKDYNFTFSTKSQKDTLYLPDSSIVILNKYSTVNYSSSYNKTERRITLVGEAYFDVKKNPEVPFVVKMEKSQITVLGTAFDVKAYAKDNFVKATLIRGIIRFDANENRNVSENQITLRPNQELKFNKLTEDISIKNVNASSSLVWIDELHKFQSKTLASLLNDLGNIYNKQINLSDNDLAGTVISGSFRDNQSLDEILKIISRSVPMKWKINNDTVRIIHN